MTDPKLLVEQLRELADENREKAENEDVVEEQDYLTGAAAAYDDAANHVEEELVRRDTVTVATVDFAFYQAQMAHALERAIIRDENEEAEDLAVDAVRTAHEQMLSILEEHADNPQPGIQIDGGELSEEEVREAFDRIAERREQRDYEDLDPEDYTK